MGLYTHADFIVPKVKFESYSDGIIVNNTTASLFTYNRAYNKTIITIDNTGGSFDAFINLFDAIDGINNIAITATDLSTNTIVSQLVVPQGTANIYIVTKPYVNILVLGAVTNGFDGTIFIESIYDIEG